VFAGESSDGIAHLASARTSAHNSYVKFDGKKFNNSWSKMEHAATLLTIYEKEAAPLACRKVMVGDAGFEPATPAV